MQKLLLLGLAGGVVYWWFVMKREPVPAGQAIEMTGAPQPQGVQGHEPAIVDHYDLQAFPMGAFADRR